MNKAIDISNTILKTKRLTLRPWQLTDLDDLYAYASVDGVGQMAGWPPHEDKQASLTILKMFIDEKKVFALVLNGKVVGSLGIEKYNEKRFLSNNQSARVQQKCGFKHYAFGTIKTLLGTTEDDEVNILTKQDWQYDKRGQICLNYRKLKPSAADLKT